MKKHADSIPDLGIGAVQTAWLLCVVQLNGILKPGILTSRRATSRGEGSRC